MHIIPRVARNAARAVMASPAYETWTREELIARLQLLDDKLPSSRTHIPPTTPTTSRQRLKLARHAEKQPFSFSSYPRRKIALKFCYAGWEYNGLAFQNDKTPLPTVEGTLYNALVSCRLIDPEKGAEGCGWERCGRTDRGVSAAGQVVSLWVRSNVGDGSVLNTADGEASSQAGPSSQKTDDGIEALFDQEDSLFDGDLPLLSPSSSPEVSSNPLPIADIPQKPELRYISMLNRVLPPSIRILAWAPVAPSFSARFACKYRHYKYFFRVQGTKDGLDLDVEKMMDAAERLIGEHDFRNLCKVDASKQITSFKRRILHAGIQPLENTPLGVKYPAGMWVFELVGTAFLYHQVRHIMAILFLVGAGLEPPSVMSALLNTDEGHPYEPYKEGETPPEVVMCKPEYQMADGLPLMLWNCAYDPNEIVWRTDDEVGCDEDGTGNSQTQTQVNDGNVHLFHQMSAMHTRSLIHQTLDQHFLLAAQEHHPPPPAIFPLSTQLPYPFPVPPPNATDPVEVMLPNSLTLSTILPITIGGGVVRRTATRSYVPLLRRKRLDPVEVINERWRKGKGSKRVEKAANNVDDGGDE